MNRRIFLGRTVAATVGLTVDARAAEPPLRVGLLGAAHSHALGKYKTLLANPEYKVIGVVERDPAARAAFSSANPTYLTEEELLTEAEVIVVESNVRDLAKNALKALRAGKHLHVEKPPATNLAELKEMTALARQKSLVFQTGYMWRFNPGAQKIFEAVRSGWLGNIYLVRTTMNTLVLDAKRRAEWAEFAGGAMFEQGSHLVDFIVRLLGKPKSIQSFLRTDGKADALRDNNIAILEYPQAIAVITNNTLQPNAFAHRQIEVCGSNGTALLKPIEPPTLQIDLATAAGPYESGSQMVTTGSYERYRADFVELAARIRKGVHPVATLEDEELVQEVLMTICASG